MSLLKYGTFAVPINFMHIGRTRLRRVCASALCLTFVNACSSVSHFNVVVMDPNYDLNRVTRPLLGGQRVSGTSCSNYLLFAPISTFGTLEDAYAKAISQAPGADALKDVRVDNDPVLVTVLYNRSCYKVTGVPVAYVSENAAH